MILKDLKINFLGDSITEGAGTTGREKCYHRLIKEKYGLKKAINYGLSGTRIARQLEPSEDETQFDLTFELRSEIMYRDVDAVVVFGGTNDYGHGDARFGNLDDEDIFTFCGAVNSLISKLSRNFPKAKLVFMTPIHRLNENEPSKPDGKVLKDYVDAIVEICARRGVSVINLFEINPLDPSDESIVPDGLHPNDKGHEIMADVIGKALLEI